MLATINCQLGTISKKLTELLELSTAPVEAEKSAYVETFRLDGSSVGDAISELTAGAPGGPRTLVVGSKAVVTGPWLAYSWHFEPATVLGSEAVEDGRVYIATSGNVFDQIQTYGVASDHGIPVVSQVTLEAKSGAFLELKVLRPL